MDASKGHRIEIFEFGEKRKVCANYATVFMTKIYAFIMTKLRLYFKTCTFKAQLNVIYQADVLENLLIMITIKLEICAQAETNLPSKQIQIPYQVNDDVIAWKLISLTGTLWGESTSHRRIPLTNIPQCGVWFFPVLALIKCWSNCHVAGDFRRHDVHVKSLQWISN